MQLERRWQDMRNPAILLPDRLIGMPYQYARVRRDEPDDAFSLFLWHSASSMAARMA